ncbi:MAG: hypothetical protein IE933_10945 [Sphingomonadales bacterium]|nr:hypothetical protein [Sphingomonadales bacterium]MBD3774527.1 hypothetical protein [Paracoccaceae bacterium]
MSFLSRLFGTEADPKDALRPLWRRVVEIAREPQWFRDCGLEDTIEGRFDAITAVLALFLLRMEREEALIAPSVHLTELFVEDMDGQMRQIGVGDLVVGKKMGKLVSSMGGRLGAFRDAFADGDEAMLVSAVERNMTLRQGHDAHALAARLAGLRDRLERTTGEQILAAEVAA